MEQIQAQILEDERANGQISNHNGPNDNGQENAHPHDGSSTEKNEPSQLSMFKYIDSLTFQTLSHVVTVLKLSDIICRRY